MKILKRIFSLVLTLIMIFTSIPMTFIKKFSITADATSYEVDDIIEFGMYPQSEVSDVSLITSLNSLAPSWIYWISYGYYSGDGNIGSMVSGDWMRYTDVEYNGQKYRGVKFSQYRPYYTYKTSAVTYQDDNGYDTDITYWFKFEPLEWRLLDPVNGLVICETIIDSQPFSNTLYCIGDGIYDCFNNSENITYANDYKTSSIREWLNKDFYNTAFTNEEKLEIGKANINNDGYYTSVNVEGFGKLDGDNLRDSIFLLSYNEVKKSEYKFETDSVKFDSTRTAMASDYAKIQGLYVNNDPDSTFDGNSFWSLRTPGNISYCSCYVTCQGCSRSFYGVDYVSGVRPAFCFGWGECGENLDNPIGEFESYKREHVIDNWKNLNQSFKPNYLAGKAVPMDGTNGTADYLVPGQSENMIPQGLAYWPEKDWVLISSYDKSEEKPSVIFALERETGAFVAQFNLYTKDGKPWKTHAGGIGISNNNLYITCDSGVAYFPLSDLDVARGTVKDIMRAGNMVVPYLYNKSGTPYTAYVSVSDDVLWTGNFYSNTSCGIAIGKLGILPENWFWKATDKYNSIIVGYKLSGDSSLDEWNSLKDSNHAAKFVINVDNDIDCIQGVAFKKMSDTKYNLYLSRTTDASFGALISVSTIKLDNHTIELKEEKLKNFSNLPGTEGIAFIGDDLHILYESGALSNYEGFFNQAAWNEYFKDCTDVIWKVNENDLLSVPSIKEEWFEKTDGAYAGYNHELAQFCADFNVIGYKNSKAEYKYYLENAGFTYRDGNVDTKRDEVNYFIADKKIDVNGVEKNLVFVGCIGTNDEQWYSDFDPLGKDRKVTQNGSYAKDDEYYLTHISFADAREFIYDKLKSYYEANQEVDISNSILLFTGHSRGAATVNVLAADLIFNYSKYGINPKNIYTYGFATPNTVHTSMGPMFDMYKSIINIVNPEDFVTKVLLSEWGYTRYGITYALPSRTNDKNYQEYLNRMRPVFETLRKEKYDPYKMGELKTYNAIKSFETTVKTIDNFYSDEFWYSMSFSEAIVYETPFRFFKNTLLKYLVTKNMDEILKIILFCGPFYLKMITYFAWPDVKTEEAIEAILQNKSVLGSVELGGKFEHAHLMETYAAFVKTMTAKELTDIDRVGFEGTVNCPVDIEVYDKVTGELVGRIVNNVVDEEIAAKENSVVMSVDGDSKTFWLPSNGDYAIKLIGNDEGTMDYTLSEIDSDIGEIKRVNFFDVKITDGLTMTADVEAEEFVIEEHELTFEDGKTLEPTENFVKDDIPVCNINISASKGGSASSSQTAKSGDYVSLEAMAEDGWKFAGWYENDDLVSGECNYAFVTKCDRNLEARFKHIDHSFGEWYTSSNATCETIGTKKRDCSVCNDAESEELSALGHSYESKITEATCAANGFTTHTCSICGEGYTSDFTEKLHHDFDEWYVYIPAKCIDDGIEKRECSQCDYFETQEIAATGHDFDGSECKNCDYNHADDCSCNCHAGGIKGFFFKIGLFFQRIFKKNKVCKCGSNHY